MMQQLLISAAAIGLLTACGEMGAADARSAEIQASGSEPQVGDQIPTSESEESTRLAEAGSDANALAARGVREIGWEELMPEGEEERLAQLYQQHGAGDNSLQQ